MTNSVLFGQNARKKLFDGIEKVAQAVMVTMGPM
jgi:chaperonin GroEL (HSP60 family)